MVELNIRERNFPGYRRTTKIKFRKAEFHGKLYSVDGETVELFPVSVMALALDRSPLTLKEYEKEGRFPRPLYEVAGRANRRWYSATQISNIHRLWFLKYGGLKTLNAGGPGRLNDPDGRMMTFWKEVRAVFYERGLLSDEVLRNFGRADA